MNHVYFKTVYAQSRFDRPSVFNNVIQGSISQSSYPTMKIDHIYDRYKKKTGKKVGDSMKQCVEKKNNKKGLRYYAGGVKGTGNG